MYDAIDDPYTYKDSTVLVNKLDLRDQAELDAFEAEISTARAQEALPEGEFDYEHFKSIHHHLFQDVYDWAGQARTVRISKGGNPFCFPENIESQAARLFDGLQRADYLRSLDVPTFCSQAAHFLAELNAIHPFREGNGRTQLTFLTLLADRAGHPLVLKRMNPERIMRAVIASFGGQEAPLAQMILNLIESGR